MRMTSKQLNREAAKDYARYTHWRGYWAALGSVPPGTWIRWGRDDDWLEVHGHHGEAIVLGVPGKQPHLIHHGPHKRVEVLSNDR